MPGLQVDVEPLGDRTWLVDLEGPCSRGVLVELLEVARGLWSVSASAVVIDISELVLADAIGAQAVLALGNALRACGASVRFTGCASAQGIDAGGLVGWQEITAPGAVAPSPPLGDFAGAPSPSWIRLGD